MLSGPPERKKAAMCLVVKMHVLDEPRSGVSHAVGRELNINEVEINIKYGIFKPNHT